MGDGSLLAIMRRFCVTWKSGDRNKRILCGRDTKEATLVASLLPHLPPIILLKTHVSCVTCKLLEPAHSQNLGVFVMNPVIFQPILENLASNGEILRQKAGQ